MTSCNLGVESNARDLVTTATSVQVELVVYGGPGLHKASCTFRLSKCEEFFLLVVS